MDLCLYILTFGSDGLGWGPQNPDKQILDCTLGLTPRILSRKIIRCSPGLRGVLQLSRLPLRSIARLLRLRSLHYRTLGWGFAVKTPARRDRATQDHPCLRAQAAPTDIEASA